MVALNSSFSSSFSVQWRHGFFHVIIKSESRFPAGPSSAPRFITHRDRGNHHLLAANVPFYADEDETARFPRLPKISV